MSKQSSKTPKAVRGSTAIPSEYQRVMAGEFAPFHDFAANPVCKGVVTGLRDATFGRGKKKKTIRCLDLLTEAGPSTVSERTQLKGLFDAVGKGQEVYIRLTGKKKIPGQPQPMLVFDCGVRGGDPKGKKTRG